MLKLFRKTRKKLLTENKLSKYLFYAIGEILLLVIGILIALKVNNYNIQKINDAKFQTIFQEVNQNLITDIKNAELAINYYNTKDSLIQLVKNNKVTKQMYLENSSLFYLLYYYRGYSLHDNGYNILNRNLDLIPSKYETVMPYLNQIYTGQNEVIEAFNIYIRDYTYKMLERWGEKNSYFTLSKEEKIEFFLNESSFKNDAILYTRFTQDMFVRNVHNYIYNATKAFILLEEMNSKSEFDIISVYNNLINPLDTILLTSYSEENKSSLDKPKNSYPVQKKIVDRSSLFIKNELSERVYLQNNDIDINIPTYIEPKTIIYTRPIVHGFYKVVTNDGKDIGTFHVPKHNGVVIIK